MNNTFPKWKLSALLMLGLGLKLPAQELSLLGGVMEKSNFDQSSYSWQVDYRQDFYRNFAASIAMINEGHVPGHHRDGTAWQVWGRLPLFHDHISLSLGLGAYYFFDTQPLPDGDTADVHGTAPIYSLSATGQLSSRWFYRLNFNRISPAHDVRVNTMTIGGGFWLGQDKKPTRGELGDAPNEHKYVTEHELTAFWGLSIVNTSQSQQARAFAGEYRRGVIPHLDWTVTGIYEGDPQIIRRSGGATQLWFVNTFFNDRITIGGGLGPYVYLDRRHPNSVRQVFSQAAIAPLASLTFSTRLSDSWSARFLFNRVATNYDRDADIILVGLGYRWHND